MLVLYHDGRFAADCVEERLRTIVNRLSLMRRPTAKGVSK
jgi:hypothetical protein